jgi:hypothetical protein
MIFPEIISDFKKEYFPVRYEMYGGGSFFRIEILGFR